MPKKVFISYSWGTKENQDWVIDLGTRLMSDSIDVELDRWSLKDGHDVHSFMESMVNSPEIFRVLIICDKNYKEKADGRIGGVGTETQIITPEIYSNQKQEKFVPIVLEREDDHPLIPIYLSSRKYIDFSKEEYFEESYEELLRNILEVPAIPKPKLGSAAPLYITESLINSTKINSTLKTLKAQTLKFPEKINHYAIQFLNEFLEELWEFRLTSSSHELIKFGEDLTNNLKSFRMLREDFIEFLIVASANDSNFDVDELISFFEKKSIYERPREDVGSWNGSDFDNYKYIFHELFIYTIAACLQNRNYKMIGELLYSKYFFEDRYRGSNEPKRYTELYRHHDNLESYVKQLYQKSNGFAHVAITGLSEKINKNDFVLADILCYYIGELHKENYMDTWYPATYPYKSDNTFDFFNRIRSERYFHKIKPIFDVETPQQLRDEIIRFDANQDKERARYGRGDNIPFISEVIPKDKIAINR